MFGEKWVMQVFMSWLSALAAGTLWFWIEKDWTRLQPVAYMLTAILMLINRADLTGNPVTLGGFRVLLVLIGLTGVFMIWNQRARSTVRNEKLTVGQNMSFSRKGSGSVWAKRRIPMVRAYSQNHRETPRPIGSQGNIHILMRMGWQSALLPGSPLSASCLGFRK